MRCFLLLLNYYAYTKSTAVDIFDTKFVILNSFMHLIKGFGHSSLLRVNNRTFQKKRMSVFESAKFDPKKQLIRTQATYTGKELDFEGVDSYGRKVVLSGTKEGQGFV